MSCVLFDQSNLWFFYFRCSNDHFCELKATMQILHDPNLVWSKSCPTKLCLIQTLYHPKYLRLNRAGLWFGDSFGFLLFIDYSLLTLLSQSSDFFIEDTTHVSSYVKIGNITWVKNWLFHVKIGNISWVKSWFFHVMFHFI